jgi:hypothetical protein
MKSRYFFALAAIAALVGVGLVVIHQYHAGKLAQTIEANDKLGLSTTTSQQALQSYAHAHMAVSVKVYLAGSYSRAEQAVQTAANPSSNGTIYALAQASCAGHTDSITQANCVQTYLSSHAQPSSNPKAIALPAKAAYTKTYGAPGWTPDTAGIAFLAALVFVAMGGYLVLLRR